MPGVVLRDSRYKSRLDGEAIAFFLEVETSWFMTTPTDVVLLCNGIVQTQPLASETKCISMIQTLLNKVEDGSTW